MQTFCAEYRQKYIVAFLENMIYFFYMCACAVLRAGAMRGKAANRSGRPAGICRGDVRMRAWEHFKTITRHRRLVRRYCFRLGLYAQGIRHDLSKYSPAEFFRGVKYYQGYRSPNDAERRENGVSLAWLHHKGRNRHHFEYWIDYCIGEDGKVYMGGCKMPLKYVAEMFCDRIAACKIYQGEQYTDASAYDYYERSRGHILIHPETGELIGEMLRVLKEEGEDAAFSYVRGLLREEEQKSTK